MNLTFCLAVLFHCFQIKVSFVQLIENVTIIPENAKSIAKQCKKEKKNPPLSPWGLHRNTFLHIMLSAYIKAALVIFSLLLYWNTPCRRRWRPLPPLCSSPRRTWGGRYRWASPSSLCRGRSRLPGAEKPRSESRRGQSPPAPHRRWRRLLLYERACRPDRNLK